MKPAGLLASTLPHPAEWQILQEYDPVYLSGEPYCVHGFESDYRTAEIEEPLMNFKPKGIPHNVFLFTD